LAEDSSNNNNQVRKVQFTGRSTYQLSLPKKWINEMHIKAGDLVTIVRHANNSLSILPGNSRMAPSNLTNEVTAILLPNEGVNSLKRKVVSIYLAGYNIIQLKSKNGRINPSQRDAVREVVRRNLVGTEIIADASDLITIQVLLSFPELSVNTAVRRMFLIANSMYKDAMSSLAELNYELAKVVIKSDDEVDRFSLYILRNLVIATQNERILREIGLKKSSDCLSYRVAVKSIERVADHASGIADKCLRIKGQISKEVFQKMEKMSQLSLMLLGDSVEAFLRRDYTLADSVGDKAENIRSIESEILSFIDKGKKVARQNANNKEDDDNNNSTNINTKLILEDLRRTAEHATDIAEAAMNQTIDEVIERKPLLTYFKE
jgi:phosphate uptake regulator